HQRMREGPGLTCMVSDAAEADAGLFEDLAAHRVLDGLSRLDEAGECGIHAGRKVRAAAEHAAIALDRQHDRDRVGARKMLGLALGADALVAADPHLRPAAAAA